MNWQDRANNILAQDSPGTNSKRSDQFIRGVYPQHIVEGRGCYVIGGDGRRYIDFIGSLGANILGYNYAPVNEAIEKQLSKGITFSLPTELEIDTAELIRYIIPCAQKVRFLKTGGEATMAAVRFARAYCGEEVETDGYHGWGDMFTSLTPPAAGVPKIDHKIYNYQNDDEHDALIIEPVKLELNDARKEELASLRKKTKVLIFDEVVTGFRIPKYCVANYYNIQPDIICLGKAMANGMPLSVVAGSKTIMDQEDVFVSSTFSGETLSLAACNATIKELMKRNMNELYDRATMFMVSMNGILKDIGVNISGYGVRGMLDVTSPNASLFMQESCKAGILFGKAFFFSFAHMDASIENVVLSTLSDIVNKIKQGKCKMEGLNANQGFKRY